MTLEVEIRRKGWERHVTADVSKRGLFIMSAGPMPVGQLMQLHVQMPRGAEPLDMMARVARRVPPMVALSQGRLPGAGLEFFCLSTQVLNQWDELLKEAQHWLEIRPDSTGYLLYQLLEKPPPEPEPEPSRMPFRRVARPVGGLPFVADDEFAQDFAPLAPPRAPVVENRTNLIFRPLNLERLCQFIDDELRQGLFSLKIPYRMEDHAAVNLRVIHPRTQEEFLLPGCIEAALERDGYAVHFDDHGAEIARLFRQFMTSGEPPGAAGGGTYAAS